VAPAAVHQTLSGFVNRQPTARVSGKQLELVSGPVLISESVVVSEPVVASGPMVASGPVTVLVAGPVGEVVIVEP
jgi:hypothetical protein